MVLFSWRSRSAARLTATSYLPFLKATVLFRSAIVSSVLLKSICKSGGSFCPICITFTWGFWQPEQRSLVQADTQPEQKMQPQLANSITGLGISL